MSTSAVIRPGHARKSFTPVAHGDLRFRRMADAAPMMVWTTDADKRCVFLNRSWLSFTGRNPGPDLGNVRIRAIHVQDRESYSDTFTRAFEARRPYSAVYRLRRRDGQYRRILDTGVPWFDVNACFAGYLGSCVDITERYQPIDTGKLRQDLSHMARVSLMGELSASLAHELNQPLTAILSNAQAARRLLTRENPDLAELREILNDIIADDQRAGEMIRRLRRLFKKSEFESMPLSLTDLINETVGIVRSNALLKDIAVTLDLSEHRISVRGDWIQLQQVMLNLMMNAMEAMKHTPAHERVLAVKMLKLDRRSAQVSIGDSGPGIVANNIEDIFQPFVSSKPDGMGMGLSICRAIVQMHNGHIWAENKPARGAVVHVVVPMIPGNER